MQVLGDHVTLVEHAGHVRAVSRVILYYGVVGLKGSIGDLCHLQLLVVSLLGRDDWGVGDNEVVDPVVGDQVGL